MNKPLCLLAAFLGCGGGGRTAPLPEDPARHSELADDDRFVPAYGKPELQKALIAERGAEATGERMVSELQAQAGDLAGEDRLRVAVANLAVRARFIAALEACESHGEWCPPRLDDPPFAFDPDPDVGLPVPPLESPLRFDLDSWRTVATELHGRACACRTLACVDGVGVAIDVLERRPMPEVLGDEAATVSITRARECLFRLRGKAVHGHAQHPAFE